MKPITLAVAGLHSFREKQEINFEALCEGGIFGIFGPTGSGKSSILDAMTLALYGKVERAANNTHGILNHAEDSITVSFTFQLEKGSQKNLYKVERVFKRSDDMRVKTSICRLLDLQGETSVIADKANEVNEQIYQLLGLTIDDFTRAVVLPQGKFAEFLSLKGTERRQMLQRLFHLEQYGDELLKKLRGRLSRTRISLEKITAEQAGLGEASAEALKLQKEEAAGAELLLKKRKAELQQVTEEYQRLKEIWQLQAEESEYLTQLANVEKDSETIESFQSQLQISRVAEGLKPYAEQVEAALSDKKLQEQSAASAKMLHEEAEKDYRRIEAAYKGARERKAQEEPQLVARLEGLKVLKEIAAEVQRAEEESDSLQRQINHHSELLKQKEKERERIQNLLKKAIDKQLTLKKQEDDSRVPAQLRSMLQKAASQKIMISTKNGSLTDAHEALAKKGKIIEQHSRESTLLQKKMTQQKEDLAEAFKGIEKLYGVTSERERETQELFAALNKRLEMSQRASDAENRHKLAHELAKQLEKGDSCPVCGSEISELPFSEQDADNSESRNLKSLSELKKEKEAGFLQSFHSFKVKMEELSGHMISQFPFIGSVKEDSAADPERLLEEELPEHPVQFQDRLAKMSAEMKALQQDLLHIKELVKKRSEDYMKTEREQQQLLQRIETHGADRKEMLERSEFLSHEVQQLITQWKTDFPEWDVSDIDRLNNETAEKDKAAEELAARISTSIRFIEENEQLHKKLQEEEQDLKTKLLQLKLTFDHTFQVLSQKKKQLGDENLTAAVLSQQFSHTEQTLSSLIDKEEKSYNTWQAASKKLQELDSERKAASSALAHADKKAEEAKERWTSIIKDTEFLSVEEVLKAILPQEIREKMEKKIADYTEAYSRLRDRLNQIKLKKGGKSLTQEKWDSVQSIKLELEELASEAVEHVGAARRALGLMEIRHNRYMQLQKEKEEAETKAGHFEKLQQVLKGNSFVEFLAEEQLAHVSRTASDKLGVLTRQRYAIEVDSQGGFIMRDNANGGVKRPVSSLSGGETFLTSLALALSLSTQIQLRGEYPLQFFFLDEGFGTLDSDLLDTVVSSLEKLQSENLSVGVISHVQELRARLPKKLIVEPAHPSGKGSTVKLEII
ncbi:AAA family ATPase [Bacillus lacus]|uniref:Nuclease SbcCD subunit C n=1 Tax=Metabacillus lacus TaxID=1983721 RepID=A0A7X2LZZ1_9BACI|nr:SMC family ATPase [Metabacillus lacus]MRX73523.1 AAA family ATPase [Metabacillus lacus]